MYLDTFWLLKRQDVAWTSSIINNQHGVFSTNYNSSVLRSILHSFLPQSIALQQIFTTPTFCNKKIPRIITSEIDRPWTK
jgi:hypothetical protein